MGLDEEKGRKGNTGMEGGSRVIHGGLKSTTVGHFASRKSRTSCFSDLGTWPSTSTSSVLLMSSLYAFYGPINSMALQSLLNRPWKQQAACLDDYPTSSPQRIRHLPRGR